jgi:hypothetical protein
VRNEREGKEAHLLPIRWRTVASGGSCGEVGDVWGRWMAGGGERIWLGGWEEVWREELAAAAGAEGPSTPGRVLEYQG